MRRLPCPPAGDGVDHVRRPQRDPLYARPYRAAGQRMKGHTGDGPAMITEPSRRTPVHGEFDVVVVGGGPAGIMAASAAARTGHATVLLERYGFLGGAGTAGGL